MQQLKNYRIYFYLIFLQAFVFCLPIFGQTTKLLHYSETSGYDHLTRTASFTMFQQMGNEHGFTVDNDSTGESFNSLSTLQQYDVIIFCNTSGDAILDATQQQNFEQYIIGGGSFVGIHAASDTYRHSTANGTNTGSWDWYAEMLGASVQQDPNHVSGTPVYSIDALIAHPLLDGVPNPWYKAEEYYYWESGYFSNTNIVLQKVEQTVGPNSLVNSYDSARAVTWYSLLPGGGKSFYTSLGHALSNYTSDTSFYQLISNAVLWAGDNTSTVVALPVANELSVFPNPVEDCLTVTVYPSSELHELRIYNSLGEETGHWKTVPGQNNIDVRDLPAGIYFIQLSSGKRISVTKFVKQ